MSRLITADHVCVGAEAVLTTQLQDLIARLELEGFEAPKEWTQVPTLEALTSAAMPAGAITSPGLVEPPTRRGMGTYDATWRLSVGVYDRGTDYWETQGRIRQWAGLVRAVLLEHPTLGGLVNGLTWVGEEYRQLPERSAARTLAGCAVAFDVLVKDVVDTTSGTAPNVQSTHTTITVRSRE